ncbi:ribonuclease R [Aliidongia dinghuensis]|uniref:Ribonuclease R n=1 Tax=Aliidongia dinghuensis TaxID=1867774 RepID=A0A8J2YXJ4_9PROT|nr:ribonuclease R [Aliidongia dinghuensis]GGF36684.1 ribonuclease R [Aliidongia dinghuensis]
MAKPPGGKAPKTRVPHRVPGGLPTRQQIVEFIAQSPVPVGKREIAKAFKVGSADRVALKGLLKDIERSGPVERGPRRRLAPVGALPEIAVVEIAGIDAEGEPIVRLLGSDPSIPTPSIRLAPGRRGEETLGVRDRAVARFRRQEDGSYLAAVVRKVEPQGEHVLGVFKADADGAGRIVPTDRRNKTTYRIRANEGLGAADGDLVLAEPLPVPRLGLPHAQVIERLGRMSDPKAISLIAIHQQGIPVGFPEAAIKEAEAAKPVTLGSRTDLRDFPLVTIDGADARDFDDAVWAAPDDDPENPGGWHLLVAIADVSWYVRPGSALDRSARERGNSVYFPDRVVPMLPEALSNELCSLKPAVERACMAIHLWLDADGKKLRHKAVRGLMRSAARLTYEQVQAAIDGRPDDTTGPLVDPVIRPLYGAYAALDKARRKRGTLDLDIPERRVVLGPDGTVERIDQRERLDSHKLIEEFMIAANVAAAEILEKVHKPCMYRVHDAPDPEKLASLREFLEGLEIHGLQLAKGQVVRPTHFNRILAAAEGRPEAAMINELVLRSQAQAMYAPDNLGHFGLALKRYAHFTSPIRRYADLLVHRAMVAGLHLGDDGLDTVDPEAFAELGVDISRLEGRAATAERSAVDRYLVAYMAQHVGTILPGRVNGVTRFGLFVTLAESGADGLVPISSLPADYYHHDERAHRLVGQRSGRVYRLGDTVDVRLAEADPVAGGLTFQLIDGGGEDRVSRKGQRLLRTPPKDAGRKFDGQKFDRPGRKRPGTAPGRR